MKGDREKCLQAGASDYIAKPVNTDQLLSLLGLALVVPLTESDRMSEDVKVLIVDDEPRPLETLVAVLAWALVRGRAPPRAKPLRGLWREFAAMIFDIRMPPMGGIELANLVKQRRRTQDVPIIFLTAHSTEDEDVLRGYDVGAVDYLSKPVNARIPAPRSRSSSTLPQDARPRTSQRGTPARSARARRPRRRSSE